MRQQRSPTGTNQEIKPYSVTGYSTLSSPKNVNMQSFVPVQTPNYNNQFQTYVNPQRANFKPLSVPIFSPNIASNNTNSIPNQKYVSATQNVGATNNPIITKSVALNNPQNISNRYNTQSQQYQRIANTTQKLVPSRPNYHFFGDNTDSRQNNGSIGYDSRQAISRNNSPNRVVQQQISIKNHEPHSLSPISLRSDSSQANKMKHKVRFFYTNTLINQASIYNTQKLLIQNQANLNQPVQTQQNNGMQINQVIQINEQSQQIQGQVIQSGPYPINQTTVVSTTTVIWQHRFVEIYSKFQIFVQKFERIIQQIYYIDDLFDNVNDQQAWNDLRVRYADMIDNFNMMREDIILVLQQNKTVINNLSPEVVKQLSQNYANQEYLENQNQNQNQEQNQQNNQHQQQNQQEQQEQQDGHQEQGGQTGKSGSQYVHIWENRCMQLMQQHQLLTRQNNQLKFQIQRLRMNEHGNIEQKRPIGGQNQSNAKLIQMQKNLNLVHSQYQKLEDNYHKLSTQYTRVISQLQNRGPNSAQDTNRDLIEMQQQLEMARSKINQLYEELQKKTQNIDQLQKQIQNYGSILQQHKDLIQTVNKMNHDLNSYDIQLQNKQKIVQDYDIQMKKLHLQINQYTKIIEQNQYPQTNSNNRPIDDDKRIKQIEELKNKQKYLVNMIQKHEQTVEQLVQKNQKIVSEHERISQDKDEHINNLQRLLDQQRIAKQKLQIQLGSNPFQNIKQTKIFKQRLQIEIQEVLNQKNRKIKYLNQNLQELKSQLQSIQKDKQKQIKQIKAYFAEQEDKYIKKIHDKQGLIKLLQQKTRSFQTELSNRNLEISRFRHQSPVNNFNGIQDESRKFNQKIERKNHDIQQLKRTIEQKNIQIKEIEQRNSSLQQEINSKIFQINSLKRQINDLHTNKAEIDNLNNILKKKNQQINQIRLTGVQIQQLKMNIDSLEREKLRINQYLKQKTRQCESKDNTIQSLQKKISTMSSESAQTSKKYSPEGINPTLSNYQNLLKQKQSQIKNLKYQLQMLETKISIGQKNIKDLNSKVNNYQKSAAILKAEMQNKVNRYETQIKNLSKQNSTLKEHKQQYKNLIQSLQSKNTSLQNSLDERNTFFERQFGKGKQKISSVEQLNTDLQVEHQLLKSKLDRLTKENKDLNQKIKVLQNKIETKNNAINQIKGNYNRKQKQDLKTYEEKIKKLDGELKLSNAKLKNMQQEISNLNKRIKSAQSYKKSYRQRLLTQHNYSKQEFIDFKSQYEVASQEILQMDKFNLKDPQANQIFERKVIYELKRQNDLLRRQISGISPHSYSGNKVDTKAHYLSYQQQFLTDRADRDQQLSKQEETNNQLINFYKNKNKELESRVDELLKVNNQFKAKLAALGAVSSNQLSIQFYKDQVTKLESENTELQAKIKKMLSDHQLVRDEASRHQFEVESLQQKLTQLNSKITELKNTIRKHEQTITQLQNNKAISSAQIERLKQMIQRNKADKQQISEKDRIISQLNKKIKYLQQQITRITTKFNQRQYEINRLNEIVRSKKSQFDTHFSGSNQQIKKLKLRISQLEKQLGILNMQHHTQNQHIAQNQYKIQKIRSFLVAIQSLVGQISLPDRRSQDIVKQIRQQIQQGFNIVSSIQV